MLNIFNFKYDTKVVHYSAMILIRAVNLPSIIQAEIFIFE
jgi:hypothetical protein